jgi:hypothetical protein
MNPILVRYEGSRRRGRCDWRDDGVRCPMPATQHFVDQETQRDRIDLCHYCDECARKAATRCWAGVVKG